MKPKKTALQKLEAKVLDSTGQAVFGKIPLSKRKLPKDLNRDADMPVTSYFIPPDEL